MATSETENYDDLKVAVQKKCAADMLKSCPRVTQTDKSNTVQTYDILSIEKTIRMYEDDDVVSYTGSVLSVSDYFA